MDGLGSITQLVHDAGSIIQEYTYDSYGNIESITGVLDPYTYTGREYDAESGLYYYRARYYDPQIGRFLSPDPIGFEDGLNLYIYAANNPLSFIDPWGLCKEKWAPADLGYWLENRMDVSMEWLEYEGGNLAGVLWNTAWATTFDLSRGFTDLLKFGEGFAEYSVTGNQYALWGNVGRGSALMLMMAGAAKSGLDKWASRGGTSSIDYAAGAIEEWVGPDGRVNVNKSGDTVFISKGGTKRVRFDINNPHPHQSPHGHIEELVNGRWQKSGPIYPKGVPRY